MKIVLIIFVFVNVANACVDVPCQKRCYNDYVDCRKDIDLKTCREDRWVYIFKGVNLQLEIISGTFAWIYVDVFTSTPKLEPSNTPRGLGKHILFLFDHSILKIRFLSSVMIFLARLYLVKIAPLRDSLSSWNQIFSITLYGNAIMNVNTIQSEISE